MIVANANRLLGFIRRSCAEIVGSVALLRLYCSLVRSLFCYCSQLWAPQSVISNLFLVEKVQRRATHFILKNSSNLSYKDRLRWLKTVSNTHIWMGRYNHSLSFDATIMVSKNCSIIGKHVAIIFLTQ